MQGLWRNKLAEVHTDENFLFPSLPLNVTLLNIKLLVEQFAGVFQTYSLKPTTLQHIVSN